MESVEMAISMLDGSFYRPNSTTEISVTQAVFEQKGEEYTPKRI
jgi:hypothetical protein